MPQTLSFALEIKTLGAREFEGYGSVYGNVDLGGEVCVQGCMTKSLNQHKKAGSMPKMFWMHNPEMVPGKWVGMSEDSKGLHVKGVLADTPLGNEIHTLLKMDAVSGLSIGYQTVDSEYTKDGVRMLKELDLWEVSPVSLAMNPLAKVESVKSPLTRLTDRGVYVPTAREFEEFLRDPSASPLGRLTKDARRFLTAKLFDSPGGMPDLSMFDKTSGGMPDESVDELSAEEAEMLQALLLRDVDRVGAAAFKV